MNEIERVGRQISREIDREDALEQWVARASLVAAASLILNVVLVYMLLR